MFPSYAGPHRFLAADDSAGIQSIYGPRLVERGNLLHLSGVTSDGRLWHTIRFPTGEWSAFGDVEGQTGDRGFIVDVDLQNIADEVHLCAINSSGGLWHTIRRANGTWFGFGDVEGQTGDRGSFVRVGITGIGNELHVCGVTSNGRLWHTIRRANGSWFPFGDIEGQTGTAAPSPMLIALGSVTNYTSAASPAMAVFGTRSVGPMAVGRLLEMSRARQAIAGQSGR